MNLSATVSAVFVFILLLAGCKPTPSFEQPNLSPRVSVVHPEDDTSFDHDATIDLAAEASDVDGTVSKVVFVVDGEVFEDTVAPYQDTVEAPQLGPGTHTLTATAYDDKGAASTPDSVAFNVEAQPGSHALTVTLNDMGNGRVTSSPEGINCGDVCEADFAADAVVTLTAAAATGSVFTGWEGACTGSGTCDLTINAAKDVTAKFSQLDLVVLMLGTNDLKHRFGLSAFDISEGIQHLAELVLMSSAGPGETQPQLLLVVPPHLNPEGLGEALAGANHIRYGVKRGRYKLPWPEREKVQHVMHQRGKGGSALL